MEVDIACVGFGPAMGGFLTTLSRALQNPDGTPAVESRNLPGAPPQVVCYERADDISFGVSGVVTRARSIRATFPDFDPAQVPMAAPVSHEKLVYLLDPIGASRRSRTLRVADRALRALGPALGLHHHALELPWIPRFLRKDDGFVLSIGQFNQWVGSQLMASGAAQIWPGTPVAEALIEGDRVAGIRLLDQGVDPHGQPEGNFVPGMEVRAALTVIADGPVGAIGRQLDDRFGMPGDEAPHEWAVGMKMVVDLPATCELAAGTVLHTLGYPEPEIFGFLYVHPGRVASVGIFVPSWFANPLRTSYRYLQHFLLHPYLWRHLEGGTLRSFGAKSLRESGRRGEPRLAGNGYARIGESSGSTNVLTGSGVDEAWTTGVQLAEAVLELWKLGRPFTREALEQTYVARRRGSWLEREARVAEHARDGFNRGFLRGLLGMALAGLTRGQVALHARARATRPTAEQYFAARLFPEEIAEVRQRCAATGAPLHDAFMDRAGWPPIPFDGRLLMSQQDALLMGGKVQAPPGYADHVTVREPRLCRACLDRACIGMCSAQALTSGAGAAPNFDREKCVHCGACLWNCTETAADGRSNLVFQAGAGGLHSAEN